MAELNAGVNRYVLGATGPNGKTAFTTETPGATGFGESTHHFEKSSGDTGVFVYSSDVTSITVWQKISGSWKNCGTTGNIGQLSETSPMWNLSFAWRDGATHMHFQADGVSSAGEELRVIRIEENMIASLKGNGKELILLLDGAGVDDSDSDGDIEVTSGVGYVRHKIDYKTTTVDGTTGAFDIELGVQASGGVIILNDTTVLKVSEKTAWDGTNTVFEGINPTLVAFKKKDEVYFWYQEGSTYTGNVSDGAISGATVTDVATGATALTDSNGDFTFSSTPSGVIESTGGVDVVTGDAYVGTLKGNGDYLVISPLTTAAIEVAADSGVSFDQAVDDILDNSEALFGIAFSKDDKDELLTKRFIDEAANGNTKAIKGSALMSLLDSSAEVYGEALTHMSDATAGNLASDSSDGKKEAYKGIARLVREAKLLTSDQVNDLSEPLVADATKVTDNVALNKGAATVNITLLNSRGSAYKSQVGNLVKERSEDFREALDDRYDENYAITRVQSIAKTTKNEDKTALEAFTGAGINDTLTKTTVDNTKVNQIGSVPNKTVEETKYSITEATVTSLSTTDTSDLDEVASDLKLGKGETRAYGYISLAVKSQLYLKVGGKEAKYEPITFKNGKDGYIGNSIELSKSKKYRGGKMTIGLNIYTFDFNGIITAIESAAPGKGKGK